MSIRQSHGVPFPTLPQSRDLPSEIPVASRSAADTSRDALGRYRGPNPDSGAARWRGLIADGLGRDLPGAGGELGRRAYRMYRSYLRDLPCDCASVRSLVAQRARAAVLADAYGARGAELGIATVEGAAALEQAARWCARAERLAISSLDVACRLAKAARARPLDIHAAVEAAFGQPEGTP